MKHGRCDDIIFKEERGRAQHDFRSLHRESCKDERVQLHSADRNIARFRLNHWKDIIQTIFGDKSFFQALHCGRGYFEGTVETLDVAGLQKPPSPPSRLVPIWC